MSFAGENDPSFDGSIHLRQAVFTWSAVTLRNEARQA